MPVQEFTPAPPMVRMANGSFQPAADMRQTRNTKPQKMLIVLQYYGGDQEAAEDLGSLIADLERIRNHDADIMIFSRFDAPEFSRSVRQKLEGRFDRVFFEVCRRKDATKYPYAANQMWHDLVTLVAQYAPWSTDYYAFLPLESDCTPVHPGWIRELVEEFRMAKARGKFAIGHVHSNPRMHLNGVAVYDTQFWRIVGSGKLNGGSAQIAYDIYHSQSIVPLAQDTPLIMFDYQRPTITADDLFRAWKGGIEPALFHGVKDGTARAAVRARHIAFTDQKEISRSTVFTYIHHKSTLPLPAAEAQKAALWTDGWRSRGWNPVVLRLRDAVRHPRYSAVLTALSHWGGNIEEMEAMILRWVALDSMGGGLLVDLDVLPGDFSPSILTAESTLFHGPDDTHIIAAFMTRATIGKLLDYMARFVAAGDGLPVSDLSILVESQILFASDLCVEECGVRGWRDARLIAFKHAKMMAHGVRGMPATVMEEYLQGAK